MSVSSAFELDINPGTSDDPACVRIALQKATFDPSGSVFVTAECLSLEELEGLSTLSRMNWTRSASEPAERSKPPETENRTRRPLTPLLASGASFPIHEDGRLPGFAAAWLLKA